MALLSLPTNTSYAGTSATQSNIGTATTLAIKARISGSFLLNSAATGSGIVDVRSVYSGGTQRLSFQAARSGGSVFLLQANGGAAPDVSATIAEGSINSGDFYIAYMHIGAGGRSVVLFADDGTELASGSGAGAAVGNNGAANSLVFIGDRATGGAGSTGTIDGVAIYSAALSGTDRYAMPTSGDANILWAVLFDEGTGSTAANIVSGATNVDTFSGATWTAGGTWDGPAGGDTVTALMADTFSFTDSPARQFWGDRQVAEALAFADTPSRTGIFARSNADSFTFSDTPTFQRIVSAILADIFTFADTTRRWFNGIRRPSDSFNVSENFTYTSTGGTGPVTQSGLNPRYFIAKRLRRWRAFKPKSGPYN